ncbi:hypothetical protein TNCV_1124281 [Trichonephila clavipes]|uniref:Uncharacterized protein n=1 Tax=Trichonephila clavipes TaxID=2585209 RepID=A0A8X6SEU2_TRICX|nr:hypothetical protein TNCV_1124281 [Trichonephila clavipes]
MHSAEHSFVVADDLRHFGVPESGVLSHPRNVRLLKGLVTLLAKEDFLRNEVIQRYASGLRPDIILLETGPRMTGY